MPKPTEVPGLSEQTPLSVAGPLLVRARLSDVRRHEPAFEVETEPEEDAVHDMRVAARRLRAAVVLLGRKPLAALEPEVKALQDALGALRDLQVQRAWVAGAARSAIPADALARWIDGRRGRAEKKARRAVSAWRAAVAAQVEDAAAAVRRGRLGGPGSARRVGEHLDRVARRADRVRERATPRRLHRLRIEVKKLRYAVELVRPAFDGAGDLLDTLVPLQEALGEVHDAHVRIELLESLVQGGKAPERRLASALLERVRPESAKGEESLRRELARWDEERLLRKMRKRFR